ncbi:hypothetical protein G7K_4552-t1 [Saitoella complicata NRRL Y-17804]|uniref:Uncharacterized protein n=1 Tax=Saitoella complicata (strain BCRC 22490 / CBS 7301 / JCM 7358 / NBRC 10748 / NRRL Y-17804) TaxID=698492 RepID=A0A0E9NL78_SAICN|nr:hypothetical protein G7K_4552-t1 [Saitoella complicata NRRL Y-17804]
MLVGPVRKLRSSELKVHEYIQIALQYLSPSERSNQQRLTLARRVLRSNPSEPMINVDERHHYHDQEANSHSGSWRYFKTSASSKPSPKI